VKDHNPAVGMIQLLYVNAKSQLAENSGLKFSVACECSGTNRPSRVSVAYAKNQEPSPLISYSDTIFQKLRVIELHLGFFEFECGTLLWSVQTDGVLGIRVLTPKATGGILFFIGGSCSFVLFGSGTLVWRADLKRKLEREGRSGQLAPTGLRNFCLGKSNSEG